MNVTEFTGIVFVLGVIVFLCVLIRLFDRMEFVKRSRRGYDAGWLVIGVAFLCVIIAGVLAKKGLI